MRRSVMAVGVAAAVLLFGARDVQGQQAIQLRYDPPTGAMVQALWRHSATRTVTTPPRGMTVRVVEATEVTSVTQRAVGRENGRTVVDVTIDSTLVQVRSGSGAWETIRASEGRTTVRLVVDDRLRPESVSGGAIAGGQVLGRLRAFASGFEFPLPEGPVVVGESWVGDVIDPLVTLVGIDAEPAAAGWLAQAGAMIARSTFTVDSIVDRAVDTLAYLRVSGSFLPTTLTAPVETAQGHARIDGGFGARLIWSTAWHTFVSGAVQRRVRVRVYVGTPEDEREVLTMTAEIAGRFRVQ
ncbi:MAG: hypothetical protein OER90_15895 [Gemmatimonadota bacterium]|nr:hypothetical protein [Gemmatimonadota bacterium]